MEIGRIVDRVQRSIVNEEGRDKGFKREQHRGPVAGVPMHRWMALDVSGKTMEAAGLHQRNRQEGQARVLFGRKCGLEWVTEQFCGRNNLGAERGEAERLNAGRLEVKLEGWLL